MREVDEDERLIRRFLLGESGEEERERLEESFMSDREYQERVLMAEDDLIEDYLEDALSEDEKQKVLAHLLSTTRQRRKLALAQAAKAYALAHPPAADRVTRPAGPGRQRYLNAFRSRKLFISLPVAAALIIATLSALWLVRQQRPDDPRTREQTRRLAIERELAELNDPRGTRQAEPGSRVVSLVLPPVSVRGAGTQNRLPLTTDTAVAELSLVLVGNEYPSYSAALRRAGTPDEFTINGLRAEDTPGGRAVRIRIPARVFTGGAYQLRLSGITSGGQLEEVGEYVFEAVDATTRDD